MPNWTCGLPDNHKYNFSDVLAAVLKLRERSYFVFVILGYFVQNFMSWEFQGCVFLLKFLSFWLHSNTLANYTIRCTPVGRCSIPGTLVDTEFHVITDHTDLGVHWALNVTGVLLQLPRELLWCPYSSHFQRVQTGPNLFQQENPWMQNMQTSRLNCLALTRCSYTENMFI